MADEHQLSIFFVLIYPQPTHWKKTLMLGKTEGKRRKWWHRMRWLNSITNSRDMNLGKLWEIVRDRESWHATVYGVTKSHMTWWLNNNNYSQTFILCLFPQHFSSVQPLSCAQLSVTPRSRARQASLSITNCQSLPKLMSLESVMPSNHLILCRPLLPPSIFTSIKVFSNELVLHIRGPKYWSFNFNISPSNEYSGLISFRMDWLDLPSVQGTLKNLLQCHSSKVSVLRCSAFFMVQLSHPYIATRKTIALTRWTYVGKVISLLFNMLSRQVITFLPRSKQF